MREYKITYFNDNIGYFTEKIWAWGIIDALNNKTFAENIVTDVVGVELVEEDIF